MKLSELATSLFPISIKGILIIDNKIMLLKNDRNDWELPDGKIEVGETAENCLIRASKKN